MFIIRVIPLVYIVVLVCSIDLLSSMKTFHIERVDGNCPGGNVPIRGTYRVSKFDSKSRVIYLNATLNITEELPGEKEIITKVIRCRSKESLDTCETFITTRPENYCDMLNPGKALNFKIFDIRYTPEFICPIKKGFYRAYNGKFDLKPLIVFPLGNWYWKGFSEIRDVKSKRLIYCFSIEGFENAS